MTIPVIIFIAIILTIFIAWTAIANRNPTNIGKDGENKVAVILRSLPKEYLVINNLIIPDQGTYRGKKYTTQIDHVVLSPFGIFVIETKNYSGWIFGAEKSKRWKETFKTMPGHYFYNPIKQNWGHTYALAEYLHLNIWAFKPVVVFSDKCGLHVETTTPVVYMSQLKGFILSYTQEIIPRMNIKLIYDRLSKIQLTGEDVENRHIQSIEERHFEKEMALKEGRCPRCGGELRLRNGKYGAFYGCSNYPQCRYTVNVQ